MTIRRRDDVSGFDVGRAAVTAVISVVFAVAQYRSWRTARTTGPGGDGGGEPLPWPHPADQPLPADDAPPVVPGAGVETRAA
jgi:hypothetical protein